VRTALLLVVGAGACTVAIPSTPDAGACLATPDIFVSEVWPCYLAATSCGLPSTCHDFSDGHGYFRLRQPEPIPPLPGQPIDQWPTAWRENYLAAIQLLDCAQPLDSRLLRVPEGLADPHPPGPVVLDRATAAEVIQAWVAGPR
jgi:hypothetical protein